MRKELEQYLEKTYPKLYLDEENKSLLRYGFECEDGWFRLILWLSSYIQQYIDQNNEWAEKYPTEHTKIEQVKVRQVKEKFGSLRYYIDGGDEHINNVIDFSMHISGGICEYTGLTENVGYNREGWIKTSHFTQCKNKNDFYYVDSEELRQILNKTD